MANHTPSPRGHKARIFGDFDRGLRPSQLKHYFVTDKTLYRYFQEWKRLREARQRTEETQRQEQEGIRLAEWEIIRRVLAETGYPNLLPGWFIGDHLNLDLNYFISKMPPPGPMQDRIIEHFLNHGDRLHPWGMYRLLVESRLLDHRAGLHAAGRPHVCDHGFFPPVCQH